MQPSTWMNRWLAAYSNPSIQEKRAIRDFALLWSFFEEIWLGNRGDVPRIRLEVEARLAPNASMVAFEGALTYFRNRYVHAGNPTPAFAHLRVSANDRPYVLDVLSGQNNEPRRVLAALLIIFTGYGTTFSMARRPLTATKASSKTSGMQTPC